jgi:hypothetical protein
MEEYQEIKLEKYRTIICFSVLYLTFFGGKFYKTDELFGWTNLRQQKVKYRRKYFNEWYYQMEWTPWRFKWIKL